MADLGALDLGQSCDMTRIESEPSPLSCRTQAQGLADAKALAAPTAVPASPSGLSAFWNTDARQIWQRSARSAQRLDVMRGLSPDLDIEKVRARQDQRVDSSGASRLEKSTGVIHQ